MSESPRTASRQDGSTTPTYAPTLRLSPGHGLIGRRDRTVVFLPAGHHVLLDRLLQAEPDQFAAVVADIVLSDVDGAPDFVLIAWPDGPATGGVQVIARGAVLLTSTLPSLPSLTGTGSTTWVEHRVPRNPAEATLSLGSEVGSGTDLVTGVAPAGGFELRLASREAAVATSAPSSPSKAPAPPAKPVSSVRPVPPAHPRISPPATTKPLPSSHSDQVPPLDDEATLTADLVEVPQSAVEPAADTAAIETPPPPDAVVTDHPTEADDARPLETIDRTGSLDRLSALRAATGQEHSVSASAPALDSTPAPAAAPPAPPDLVPADALPPSAPPAAPPSGQPSPPPSEPSSEDPHVSNTDPRPSTRSTAGYRLVLPSGAHFDLDRTVVIGRQPAIADAGMTDSDDSVSLLPLSVPSSVSRTHAFIRVDSDGVTVVDCGSGGGTAIAGLVGELVSVEPWVPTPLAAGDTLYLGGPTALVVEEMTS